MDPLIYYIRPWLGEGRLKSVATPDVVRRIAIDVT